MATYPAEFHRRVEQKWESRIEQILSVTGTVPPPRRANDDYDDDEDADQEDGEQSDERAGGRPRTRGRLGLRGRYRVARLSRARRSSVRFRVIGFLSQSEAK